MHGLCVFFCQLASRYFELSIDKCFWSFVLVPRTCVACSASQVDFMFVQVSSHLHIPVVVVRLVLLSSVCSHLASHLADVSIGSCCASNVGVDGCCILLCVLLLAYISLL